MSKLARKSARRIRPALARARAFLRGLRDDKRGVALVELAYATPILLTLGMYGAEMAYMSTVNMQVGELATSVADNASRLGQTDNSAVTPTVTENMIDAIMGGALVEGSSFNFATRGKIILSSLERDSATGRQYIHWQRCRGGLVHASNYGAQGFGLSGATLAGMGPSTNRITANANSAVMFVEVFYQYQPLFGSMFVGNTTFSREAAFIIRDDRNLTAGVTGTSTASTCA